MISIIVPVYNTSSVMLKRCVHSLVKQTMGDIEVILIDDCSTDKRTVSTLNNLVEADERIIIIRKQQNEGRDAARHTGIAKSSGEYITFVDSDDWLEYDAIERLYRKSQETDADVVIGRLIKCNGIGPLHVKRRNSSIYSFEDRIIETSELRDKYFSSYFGFSQMPVNMCGALYKRRIALIPKPTKLEFGEDLCFNMQLFPHIRKLYAMPIYIYNYWCGIPGLSAKYNRRWLSNAVELFVWKWDMLRLYPNKRNSELQAIEMINFIKTYVQITKLYGQIGQSQVVENIREALISPVFDNLDVLKDSWYHNKTLVEMILSRDAQGVYSIICRDIHIPAYRKFLAWIATHLSR